MYVKQNTQSAEAWV